MHPSVMRLLDYARRKVRHPLSAGEIGRQMNVSAATMTNWKARGISKEGAIRAEALFGCSVTWLLNGDGREDSAAATQAQAAVADPVRQGIGLRLESARQQRKLSIQQVAEKFKIDVAAVLAWEAGRAMPDAVAIRELAKLYDVSADGLLWEDSLSPEAMQLAAEFDSLSERQKRTLSAMWMAFIRESASDAEIEDRMEATKEFKYNKKTNVAPFSPLNQEIAGESATGTEENERPKVPRGISGEVDFVGNVSPTKGSGDGKSNRNPRVPSKKHPSDS